MINTYQRLLHISYHNYTIIILLLLVLSGLTFYIFNQDLEDHLNLIAVSDGNNLLVQVPITYSDTIKGAKLKIKNKDTFYTIAYISELKYDETAQINYQIYALETDNKYVENQIVNVSFYYNKEKIIKKVIRLIKE